LMMAHSGTHFINMNRNRICDNELVNSFQPIPACVTPEPNVGFCG
jgi:hypothetical protein